MRLPKFTAGASLAENSKHYVLRPERASATAQCQPRRITKELAGDKVTGELRVRNRKLRGVEPLYPLRETLNKHRF